MPPADSASRAGVTPKAGGDRSSRTFGKQMNLLSYLLPIVTLVFLASCSAQPSLSTEQIQFRGGVVSLSPADRKQIKDHLLEISELRGSDRRIFRIEAQSSERIAVYTGELIAPLAGGGRVVYFIKDAAGWHRDYSVIIGFWNA